jgi:hypothetical protein
VDVARRFRFHAARIVRPETRADNPSRHGAGRIDHGKLRNKWELKNKRACPDSMSVLIRNLMRSTVKQRFRGRFYSDFAAGPYQSPIA